MPLYCSARFLNELAAARRPEMLTRWVLLILGLTAALGIASSILRRMEEAQRSTEYYWVNWIYGKKTLDLDFAKVDDARCRDQLSQILQTSNYGGRGIWQFTYMLPTLIGVLFKVAGGIALAVSLFTLPVEPQYQDLPLLRVGLVLAVGGILSVLILSPLLAEKRIKAELATTEAGRSGNRFFLFFAFMIFREDTRALDIRMYRQDLYALEMMEKGNSWGAWRGV